MGRCTPERHVKKGHFRAAWAIINAHELSDEVCSHYFASESVSRGYIQQMALPATDEAALRLMRLACQKKSLQTAAVVKLLMSTREPF